VRLLLFLPRSLRLAAEGVASCMCACAPVRACTSLVRAFIEAEGFPLGTEDAAHEMSFIRGQRACCFA